MQAQGFKRDSHPAAVIRRDFTIGDQRTNLVRHLVRVREHCMRLGARKQRAIRAISPVGEGFSGERMSHRRCGPLHRRAGPPNQSQRRIECPDPGKDGNRQRVVGLGLVVERTVGLDVAERGPLRSSDGLKRTKLIEDEVGDLVSGQVHRAPAETLPVSEAGMRTDGDPVAERQRNRGTHGVGVTGVKAAGNVRRADQREERRFRVPLPLADIGVQVDRSRSDCYSLDSSNEAAWSSEETFPASKMVQRRASEPAMVHRAAALERIRRGRPWRRPAMR